MDKQYYKEYYYFERNHWWALARLDILNGIIKTFHPETGSRKLKILNVGVATGATSEMLAKLGEVTSVEYDQDCCEFLEKTVGIKAVNASVLELPFKENEFDVVCAFDVIEHVEEDQKAVEELSRVTKKDGHIFITVPAFMFLWSHHDEVNHHMRRYTIPKLSQLFQNNSLAVQFKSYFNFFLFFPIAAFKVLFPKSLRSKEGTGSDFSVSSGSTLTNTLLFKIFSLEKLFLFRKIPFPVGVSVLAVLKKIK